MTTTPGNYDLTLYQGASFTLTLTWKDAANAAINLTGYSAKMQIRYTAASPSVVLELSTTNGGISLGGTAGTITLNASASQTAALTEATGVYDLELTSGSGTVTRLLSGKYTLSPEVTK